MNFTEKLTRNTIYYNGKKYVKVGQVWDSSYEVRVQYKLSWGPYYLTNWNHPLMRKLTKLEKILLAVESKN